LGPIPNPHHLYIYLKETIDYINNYIIESLNLKEIQEGFLKLCKMSIKSLQSQDPYKYLNKVEIKQLDDLIVDYFYSNGVSRRLEKVMKSLKTKYSQNISYQTSKVFYIVQKLKNSLNKIKSCFDGESPLYAALKKSNYTILQPDEYSIISRIYSEINDGTIEAGLLAEDYINNIRKQINNAKYASNITMHIHAEIKILDHLYTQHFESNLNKIDKRFYISCSKLMCYDCTILCRVINDNIGNGLKVGTFKGRGTHGLEFQNGWLIPRIALNNKPILFEYSN
jgi:hypothetical protein